MSVNNLYIQKPACHTSRHLPTTSSLPVISLFSIILIKIKMKEKIQEKQQSNMYPLFNLFALQFKQMYKEVFWDRNTETQSSTLPFSLWSAVPLSKARWHRCNSLHQREHAVGPTGTRLLFAIWTIKKHLLYTYTFTPIYCFDLHFKEKYIKWNKCSCPCWYL